MQFDAGADTTQYGVVINPQVGNTLEAVPIQPRLARNRFRSGTQSDPCISFCFQNLARTILIHGNEIGIIRPEIHREIGVFDREPERLRQLGKALHVRSTVQEFREIALEMVVTRHQIENGLNALLFRPV